MNYQESHLCALVMPTFNGVQYIQESLRSIVNQSLAPSEIIIVDDASTDGTADVAQRFLQNFDIPFNIIRLEVNSGGPSKPMNIGIGIAQHPIIILLDQDDVMEDYRIERYLEIFKNDTFELDLIFGLIGYMDADGITKEGHYKVQPDRLVPISTNDKNDGVWIMDSQKLYSDMLINGSLTGASNMIFRKRLWEEIGGFREDLRICWDYEFMCQATRLGKIGFIDERLAWYRVHKQNLSSGDHCAQEWIELLRRHNSSPLWPIDHEMLHLALKQSLFDRGFQQSINGNIHGSISSYKSMLDYGERRNIVVWHSLKAILRAFGNMQSCRKIRHRFSR